MVFLPGEVARHRHAERGGDGRGGVPDAEVIKGALLDFRKAADAAKLPEGMEIFGTPGQQLPSVALVPHVPDEPVVFGVEYGKERERQLHDSEGGGEVAAVGGNRADDGLAEFRGQHFLFGEGKFRHHRGMRDARKKRRKRRVCVVHGEWVPVEVSADAARRARRVRVMRNPLYSSASPDWQTSPQGKRAPIRRSFRPLASCYGSPTSGTGP